MAASPKPLHARENNFPSYAGLDGLKKRETARSPARSTL